MKTILTLVCLVVSSYCFGQQLVYTPVNPAFGGDPFNYTWLLNSANAQNSFQDSALSQFEDFAGFDALTNGTPGGQGGTILEPGTNTIGNFELEAFESLEGLIINILDVTTGEQSQIIIPN